MSDVIPNTIIGRIQFFQQRLAAWTADPATIGLTADQVSQLSTAFSAAVTANDAAQASRIAAKNATALQNQAMGELVRLGSGMIATIRAFADLSSDPVTVYTDADLPLPTASASPLPPPVPAADVTATLQQSGAVLVSWKGTTANGTFYDVFRRLAGENGFAFIGSSPSRSFEDAVPAGTAEVSYYTVARRDDKSSGESQQAVIRFGVQAGAQDGTQNAGPNSTNGSDNGTLGLAA